MTEQEWINIFGDNLASWLSDYKMSQKELAEETGLSEAAISNYIRKRSAPNFKAIINIAYALDISVDELIDFGDRIV